MLSGFSAPIFTVNHFSSVKYEKNLGSLIVFLFFHQHLLEVFYYCPSIWTEPGWVHWLDLMWFQSQVTMGNMPTCAHAEQESVSAQECLPPGKQKNKATNKQNENKR